MAGIFKKALDSAYKTSQNQCRFLLVSLTTKENQRKSACMEREMEKKESVRRGLGKGNESLKSKSFWWFICSPEPWLETEIFSRAIMVACPKIKINKF